MYKTHHYLHIPIMGTGFTIDTAIRVAKYGISSVLSLVDDLLIEQLGAARPLRIDHDLGIGDVRNRVERRRTHGVDAESE